MSKFIKIKCKKCNNEQRTFSHTTTQIKCSKCGTPLLYPTGGKAKLVDAEVTETYE